MTGAWQRRDRHDPPDKETGISRTAGSKGDTEGKAWAASSTAATCRRYHGAYSNKRLGYSRTGAEQMGGHAVLNTVHNVKH